MILALVSALAELQLAIDPMVVIPNPTPKAPPGSNALIEFWGMGKWIGYAIAGIALVVIGVIFLINQRRGEGAEIAPKLMTWVFGLAIIAVSSTIVQLFVNAAGS